MDAPQRDELLIRLDERTERLETEFTNHLEHHFRYAFYAWTSVIGLVVALSIIIIKFL